MTRNNILLETGTNELEIIEFTIDRRSANGIRSTAYYGINVAKVREIIRMPELTEVPELPKAMLGIFNLRERILPALDLNHYLFEVANDNPARKMIIAEFSKIQIGIIVGEVRRIHRISWSDIISPDTVHDFDPEHSPITGIVRFPDRHILMLDVEKIITDINHGGNLTAESEVHFDTAPKALTAEDSVTVRKMISDRLKKAGFKLDAYNDGATAWNRLKEISDLVSKGHRLDEFVDVVITDIEMPGMDGYSLTKKIKEDNNLRSLPVVIFSSIVSPELMHKGKSVGADIQLTKPQIGELLEVLRLLIADRKEAM